MERIIEGKNCIKHELMVSEHIKVELWIPEVLTPVDFKGLLDMSNKTIKINTDGEIVNIPQQVEKKYKVEKKYNLTYDEIEQKKINIISMRKEGKSWDKIGKYYNTSNSAIYMWARNNNIYTKVTAHRLKFTKEKKLEIIKEYDNIKTKEERKLFAEKLNLSMENLQKYVSTWKKKLEKINGGKKNE